MTLPHILVLNPNSNEAITAGLNEALEPLRKLGGAIIECLTLNEGPFGIESQFHIDQVVLPLVKLVDARRDASAFVIACYADPGLDTLRSIANVPVFGIQESGILTALARGDRVGIIAVAEKSIARHRRYMRRMGVLERVAGERALNMTVNETASGKDTLERLTELGQKLVNDGSDVIVLGCAGMARHRRALEASIGIPVVDPTQATVAMALGAVFATS